MTTPRKIVMAMIWTQQCVLSACIDRKRIYHHFCICKAAEQTDSPPTKTVLRVLQKQKYPQDYVQLLNLFHIDEPGLVM